MGLPLRNSHLNHRCHPLHRLRSLRTQSLQISHPTHINIPRALILPPHHRRPF